MTTSKLLATPVRFTSNGVDMQTFVAGLGCVAGVNKHQIHAKLYRFINEELTQLKKRPTVTSTSLCFRAWLLVGAFSDARQVFQSYSLFGASGVLDESAANGMVYLCLESSFSPTQPLQDLSRSTASRPCAFGRFLLQRRPHTAISVTNLGYFSSTKLFSIRGDGYVCSAQVNTQNFIRLFRTWWLRFKLNLQVVSAIFSLNQHCRFRVFSCQQMTLIVTDEQREFFSSLHHGQANNPVFFLKGESPGVIGGTGRSETPDRSILLFSRLAVGTNPADSMDGHLSRQPIVFSCFLVNQGLYGYLVGQLWVGVLVHILTAARKSMKHRIKFFNLLRRYFEFAANREDLRHFQLVKIARLIYHRIAKNRGVEPPFLAAIPPQVASAEPGDSRAYVEGNQ